MFLIEESGLEIVNNNLVNSLLNETVFIYCPNKVTTTFTKLGLKVMVNLEML